MHPSSKKSRKQILTLGISAGVMGVILSAIFFDIQFAFGYPTNQPANGVQGNVDKSVMVVFIHGLSEPRSKLSTYLYWGDFGLPFDMDAELTVTDNLTYEGYSIYRPNEANTNLSSQGFPPICDRGSYRNCIFYENYYNLLDNPWLHSNVPTPVQFCEARFPVTKETELYVGVDPASNTQNAVIQQMCKDALLSIGTRTNDGETIFINL